ncbi:hypothetical protein BESB_034470 [Besnoitia besnoiti]|uniref:Uncharacterized protein n=1 Tax=Besnoitia besnoiti TaxID=94643 RepID=A0A2A9MGE3_BESBE|nr:hypothetical protein BESB_034470 [Besnoitia besnoiti]PFH36989.1 hypothetical protein BESB_034470 [Besnoitia besnoiti]
MARLYFQSVAPLFCLLLALVYRADALRDSSFSNRIESVIRMEGDQEAAPSIAAEMPVVSFVEIEEKYPGLTVAEMTGLPVEEACACMVNQKCSPDN